jgi:hypothetical protein
MPPLNLYARVRISLCILHTRPRVQRAPGIPCTLPFSRVTLSRLGRIAPRDREGMALMKQNACMNDGATLLYRKLSTSVKCHECTLALMGGNP